jgi:hypothetical protein
MKKPKWPKVHEFYVPIYGGRVVLCRTYEQWRQCVLYLNPNAEVFPTTAGATQVWPGVHGSIYIVGVFDSKYRYRTLVHELGHVAFRVLGKAGVETHAGESNEAYCYLLDFLYGECEYQLRKK